MGEFSKSGPRVRSGLLIYTNVHYRRFYCKRISWATAEFFKTLSRGQQKRILTANER